MTGVAFFASDAHVREFVAQHGLRTRRTEEGELVLRLGRRDSGSFASFAQRAEAGQWAVYVFGHPRAHCLAQRFRDCVDVWWGDGAGELEMFVPEDRLLEVLGRSRWTRPQRRQRHPGGSPEALAKARARRALGSRPCTEGPNGAPNRTGGPDMTLGTSEGSRADFRPQDTLPAQGQP